jgi:lysozyme family protein
MRTIELTLIAHALRAAADVLDPPDPPTAAVLVSPLSPAAGPVPAPIVEAAVPTPIRALEPLSAPDPPLDTVQQELAGLYASCVINPEHATEVGGIVSRILGYKSFYGQVEEATGVPWYVVAAIHSLEADLDFSTHLFNGDPLSSRTVEYPPGQPKTGEPPFSWIESASAAMAYDNLAGQTDWALGVMLDRIERYNGLGYRYRNVPSPYLWSFTNHYTSGRFVADHDYNPDSVSKEAGAAALIKYMQQSGAITLTYNAEARRYE